MTQPAAAPAAYPVSLDLASPPEVHRWRPIVNWLLAIPHLLILHAARYVVEILVLISIVSIVFTKRIPRGIYGFQTMVMRYTWRTYAFAGYLRNDYPPFEFEPTVRDQSGDPATVSVEENDSLVRFLWLVKWLLAIPHLIVLAILGIAVFVVHIIAFFAVIFTGKWPEGLRKFVVGYARWTLRVDAYAFLMLTDTYPPFRLSP